MKAGPILLATALASGLLSTSAANGRRMAPLPIPGGWSIESTATGDLTGDGVSDTAVVIRQVDPKLIVKNEGMGAQELDTNPRQVLVFERTPQGFRQIAAGTKLIPPAGSADSPCLEDPLAEGGISIAKQVLSIDLHYWLSCGSYGVTNNTYQFKQLKGRFRLIGYDRLEFMRSSGEGEEVSVNFLTGRKSTTPWAAQDTKPRRPRWSRIKPQFFYLDTINLIDMDNCPKIDMKTYLC